MKRFFSILICAVLIVSLFPVRAFAEETTAATMRLVEHQGSVTVKNASGKTLKITKDMRLYNNYQITTGSKSYAYISLDDSKAIKLDASSKVTISRQGRKLEILVEKGKLLFDVTKPLKKDETLNIRTATMITGVRGTIGWVEVNSSQKSGLYLLEGTTLVTSIDPQGGSATVTSVHSGQVLTSSLSQEEGQEVLDVEVTELKEEETPGFVRVAIAENPEMQQRITDNTDLDVDVITDNAQETLEQEETAADNVEQEIQEQVEQQVTEQTDPLFEEPADPIPSTPSTPSITPIPVVTYTVIFERNGHGDTVVGQLVQEGSLVVEPTPPTAEGYSFDGWFTEPECINEWNFKRDTVTGNLTLYAKWITNRYTVSFDLNGHGSTVPAQTVLYGRLAAEPTEPSADGMIFGGWFKEKECVNRWDFSSDTVSADTILYAKWGTSTCTVFFELNGHGDAIDNQTISYGDLATEPAEPTAEGLTFEGWFMEQEFLNQWDFDSDTVTSDLTLYAKWTVKTYQITFNMNGYGSAVTAQTVAHGGTVIQPSEPAVEGMIFGGWFKETECINAWNFSTDTVTKDTTLYAKWTVKTYTVSFDMNGHGEAVTAQTITHGGTVTLPVTPTADGFTFEGWFKEADCINQWDFSTDTVTEDTTLYAKWTAVTVEPDPEPVTYTVSFDMNGHGDPIDPQTVTEGEFAAKPTDPTADGFTFEGWFKEADCINQWDFSTDTVTEDTILYAKWTEIPDTLELSNPTAEELIAALEEAAASDDIATVLVTDAALTVDTALTVSAGDTLTISDGSLSLSVGMDILGTVNIAADTTLINTGTINILSENSLHISGYFVNNADLYIGGTGTDGTMARGALDIDAIGKMENTGKIVIDTDTASTFYNSGTIINNGEFYVSTSGLFFNSGIYTENRADAVYAMSSSGSTVSYLGLFSDISAWTDGETLTILGISPDGGITLPESMLTLTGVSATLDLNGHTVTLGDTFITVDTDASLTLMDSSESADGSLTGSADCTVLNTGSFTLEGGLVTNDNTGDAIRIDLYSITTVNGGRIEAAGSGISISEMYSDCSELYINGGTFETGGSCINKVSGGGSVTITGGTFTSSSTALDLNGSYAVVTISDGTFTGTIALDLSNGGSAATITGGTFTGTTAAVYGPVEQSLMLILGGTFTADEVVIYTSGEYIEETLDGDPTVYQYGTLISGSTVIRLTAENAAASASALISGKCGLKGGKLYAKDSSYFDALNVRLPSATGPDTDGYYEVDLANTVVEVSSLAEFTAALNDSGVSWINVSNADMTLSSDQSELDGINSLEIPEGVTVELLSGSITIAEDFTLNVYGTVKLANGFLITNTGTIEVGSTDLPVGKLTSNYYGIENSGLLLDYTYLADSNTASYVTVTNITEDGEETMVYCGRADGTAWQYSGEYKTVVMFYVLDSSTNMVIPDSIPANPLGTEHLVYFGLDVRTSEFYGVQLFTCNNRPLTLGENVHLEFTSSEYTDKTLLASETKVINFINTVIINQGASFSAANCDFSYSMCIMDAGNTFTVYGDSTGETPSLVLDNCRVGSAGSSSYAIELIGAYAVLTGNASIGDSSSWDPLYVVTGPMIVDDTSRLEITGMLISCYTVALENYSQFSVMLTNCEISSTDSGITCITNYGDDLSLHSCVFSYQDWSGVSYSGTCIENQEGNLALYDCTVEAYAGTGIRNNASLVMENCTVSGETCGLYNNGTATANNCTISSYEAGPDEIGYYVNDPNAGVSTLADLITALNDPDTGTISLSDADLTLSADQTELADLTALEIPDGKIVELLSGSITIAEGFTLNVYGGLTLYDGCSLTNNGTLEIGSDDFPDAQLSSSGTIINSGDFFVSTPGRFFNSGIYTENRTDMIAISSNGANVSYLGYLQDMPAWTDSETVTLYCKDNTSATTIPEHLLTLTGVNVTIDLNGNTLQLLAATGDDGTTYQQPLVIESDASLTVMDSSAPDYYGMEGTGAITGEADHTIDCMGTLILTSGTIENTASGTYSAAIYPHGSGSVTINGGKVLGKIHAISSKDISGNSSSITIGGGYIYGGTTAVYNSGSGGLLSIYEGELVSDSVVIVSAGAYDTEWNSGTQISGNAILRLTAEYTENTTAALISGEYTIQSGMLYAMDPTFFEVLGDRRPTETGPDTDGYYSVDCSDFQVQVSTLADFVSALSNNGVRTIYINSALPVVDLTLSSDQPELADLTALEIPEGVTVQMLGGSITVAEGFTLDVYGEIHLVNDAAIINNGIYLDHTYEQDTNTESYVTVTNRSEDGTETLVYCGPGRGVIWEYSAECENIVMIHILDEDIVSLQIPDSIPANTQVIFGVDLWSDAFSTIQPFTSTGTLTLGENARLECTNADYVDSTLLYSNADNKIFWFTDHIVMSPGSYLSATNCAFTDGTQGTATITVNGDSSDDTIELELYGCSVSVQQSNAPAIALIGACASLNGIAASEEVGTPAIDMMVSSITIDEASYLEATQLYCSGLENHSNTALTLTNSTFYSGVINSGSELTLSSCSISCTEGTAIVNNADSRLVLLDTGVTADTGTGIENHGYLEINNSGQGISGATYALYNTGSVIAESSNNSFLLTSTDGFYAVYSDTTDNPDAVVELYGSFHAPTEEQIFSEQVKQDTDELIESTDSEGNITYYIRREYTAVTP